MQTRINILYPLLSFKAITEMSSTGTIISTANYTDYFYLMADLTHKILLSGCLNTDKTLTNGQYCLALLGWFASGS